MGGLAQFGLGAGAALSGFNQAIDRQQAQEDRQRRMTLADAENRRRNRILDMQEREMADTQAARDAAMKVIAEDQRAYQAEATKAVPGPTLDGGAVPRAPVQPYRPSQQALLKAARAEYDELFIRGRPDLGMERYVKAEGLRVGLRASAGQKLLGAISRGGDINGELGEFDDLVDDGAVMRRAVPTKDANGKPAYTITTANRFTGKDDEPRVVGADQLAQMVVDSMQSPDQFIKRNTQAYIENVKASNRRTLEENMGDDRIERERVRQAGATERAKLGVQGRITVAQLRASMGGGRSGSGGAGKANSIHSILKNEDGTADAVMRQLGPDGKLIRLRLTDDSGVPLRHTEAEKLLQSLTKQVANSRDGLRSTPEANRARAGKMLPMAPSGGKDFSSLWN